MPSLTCAFSTRCNVCRLACSNVVTGDVLPSLTCAFNSEKVRGETVNRGTGETGRGAKADRDRDREKSAGRRVLKAKRRGGKSEVQCPRSEVKRP